MTGRTSPIRKSTLGADLAQLHTRLNADTRSLSLAERRCLATAFTGAQAEWLPRLRQLVEPPVPDNDFPAFLLATAPFQYLQSAIGSANARRELSTDVADALQRFVDTYRDYLQTTDGEQVFQDDVRRTG